LYRRRTDPPDHVRCVVHDCGVSVAAVPVGIGQRAVLSGGYLVADCGCGCDGLHVPSTIAPRFTAVRVSFEEIEPERLRQRHAALIFRDWRTIRKLQHQSRSFAVTARSSVAMVAYGLSAVLSPVTSSARVDSNTSTD